MIENHKRIRLEGMKHFGFGPDEMRKVKVCEYCGSMMESKILVCKCGRKLPQDTLYEVYKRKHNYCKKCETVVSDSTRYCPQCGEMIEKEV